MHEYGDKKGNAKPESECRNSGPWWASFNEAACDVYSGIFCPTPRDCMILQECVDYHLSFANSTGLFAFQEYLNQAPTVADTNSTKECGDLREYLGYDPDFPDDDHICYEFDHIKCRSDFTSLDDPIANSSDGDSIEEGVLRTTLSLKRTGESG